MPSLKLLEAFSVAATVTAATATAASYHYYCYCYYCYYYYCCYWRQRHSPDRPVSSTRRRRRRILETGLMREESVAISRFRTGHSLILKAYRHRTGLEDDRKSPD